MNTPSSKPIKRFTGKGLLPKKSKLPQGPYRLGVENPEVAATIGNIVTAWSHLEEYMIGVMGRLLGDHAGFAAHSIFRSINSERLRVDLMRILLEASPINQSKSDKYDEVINEFAALSKLRNDYVHGLWHTHKESGRLYLAIPDPRNIFTFAAATQISPKQLANTLKRIRELSHKVTFDLIFLDHPQLASLDKPQTPALPSPPKNKARRTKQPKPALPPSPSSA